MYIEREMEAEPSMPKSFMKTSRVATSTITTLHPKDPPHPSSARNTTTTTTTKTTNTNTSVSRPKNLDLPASSNCNQSSPSSTTATTAPTTMTTSYPSTARSASSSSVSKPVKPRATSNVFDRLYNYATVRRKSTALAKKANYNASSTGRNSRATAIISNSASATTTTTTATINNNNSNNNNNNNNNKNINKKTNKNNHLVLVVPVRKISPSATAAVTTTTTTSTAIRTIRKSNTVPTRSSATTATATATATTNPNNIRTRLPTKPKSQTSKLQRNPMYPSQIEIKPPMGITTHNKELKEDSASQTPIYQIIPTTQPTMKHSHSHSTTTTTTTATATIQTLLDNAEVDYQSWWNKEQEEINLFVLLEQQSLKKTSTPPVVHLQRIFRGYIVRLRVQMAVHKASLWFSSVLLLQTFYRTIIRPQLQLQQQQQQYWASVSIQSIMRQYLQQIYYFKQRISSCIIQRMVRPRRCSTISKCAFTTLQRWIRQCTMRNTFCRQRKSIIQLQRIIIRRQYYHYNILWQKKNTNNHYCNSSTGTLHHQHTELVPRNRVLSYENDDHPEKQLIIQELEEKEEDRALHILHITVLLQSRIRCRIALTFFHRLIGAILRIQRFLRRQFFDVWTQYYYKYKIHGSRNRVTTINNILDTIKLVRGRDPSRILQQQHGYAATMIISTGIDTSIHNHNITKCCNGREWHGRAIAISLATVRIQCFYRQCSSSWLYSLQRSIVLPSVIRIQRLVIRKGVKKRMRKRLAETRIVLTSTITSNNSSSSSSSSCIKIQSWYRCLYYYWYHRVVILTRIIQLQKTFRRYSACTVYWNIKHEICKLQRNAREYMFHSRRERVKIASCIVIQGFSRHVSCKTNWNHFLGSICVIQRFLRCYRTHRTFLRFIHVVVTMQKFIRRYLKFRRRLRSIVLQYSSSLIVRQSRLWLLQRMKKMQEDASAAAALRSVTILQSHMRKKISSTQLSKSRRAFHWIITRARGFLAKQSLEEAVTAVTKIQQFFLRYLNKQYLALRKNAATKIQGLFRLNRKICYKFSLALLGRAIQVQSIYRYYFARKRFSSAMLISDAIFGEVHRKRAMDHYHGMRRAALRVQHWWRRKLKIVFSVRKALQETTILSRAVIRAEAAVKLLFSSKPIVSASLDVQALVAAASHSELRLKCIKERKNVVAALVKSEFMKNCTVDTNEDYLLHITKSIPRQVAANVVPLIETYDIIQRESDPEIYLSRTRPSLGSYLTDTRNLGKSIGPKKLNSVEMCHEKKKLLVPWVRACADRSRNSSNLSTNNVSSEKIRTIPFIPIQKCLPDSGACASVTKFSAKR